MGFDFELLLVLLTLVTGVVWAWDRWLRKRGEERPADAAEPWWLDLSRSLFPVILAVLVIRSFIFEPFRIPSGSMMPTLFSGDFILVNKFSYGLRLPVLHTEVLDLGKPERGDVVVFRYPLDPSQDYIKRVVGLPGDRIAIHGKQLYVNGKAVEYLELGRYTGRGAEPDSVLRRERLGEVEHPALVNAHSQGMVLSYTVPENSYFVMGDNRDRSADSRYWGAVPAGNLVGKAFFIWMSWDPEAFRVNWSRIGDRIR